MFAMATAMHEPGLRGARATPLIAVLVALPGAAVLPGTGAEVIEQAAGRPVFAFAIRMPASKETTGGFESTRGAAGQNGPAVTVNGQIGLPPPGRFVDPTKMEWSWSEVVATSRPPVGNRGLNPRSRPAVAWLAAENESAGTWSWNTFQLLGPLAIAPVAKPL